LLLHFNWPRPHRWLHAAASLAIIASTVLVKQHYVVDVVGGVAVYAAARAFLSRLRMTNLTVDGWVVGSTAGSWLAEAEASCVGPHRYRGDAAPREVR
jgi:membrane-associated phospholipid phosphatase